MEDSRDSFASVDTTGVPISSSESIGPSLPTPPEFKLVTIDDPTVLKESFESIEKSALDERLDSIRLKRKLSAKSVGSKGSILKLTSSNENSAHNLNQHNW